jgi:CheY-like chemotaxis protein
MGKVGPIILVEDDTDDQELIAEIIKGSPGGNPLRIFQNGKEAFDYLRTSTDRPFLIICDVNMPVMNGLEFRQQIHENEDLKSKEIPFIFLSTTEDKKVVDKAYELAVQGFFTKPHDFHELKNILEVTLEYWRSCLFPGN